MADFELVHRGVTSLPPEPSVEDVPVEHQIEEVAHGPKQGLDDVPTAAKIFLGFLCVLLGGFFPVLGIYSAVVEDTVFGPSLVLPGYFGPCMSWCTFVSIF